MIYIALFFLIIFVDQFTKAAIDAFNVRIEVIPNVFSIYNTRNTGAAFSFLADAAWAQAAFIVFTVIVLGLIAAYFVFARGESKLRNVSLAMISGGAVGNLIDRIALHGVRDFIYPEFFANFNVADIFVCVGTALLAVYFLFFEEEAIFGKKRSAKPKED